MTLQDLSDETIAEKLAWCATVLANARAYDMFTNLKALLLRQALRSEQMRRGEKP